MKPRLILAALPLLAAGCASSLLPPPVATRTEYFVLTGPVEPEGAAPPEAHVRIGLRDVRVPEYLDGRDIVVRSGGNELLLNDYERWAEALRAGIERVLGEQLLLEPAVRDVVNAPFPMDAAPDYIVSVRVLRCEGDTGPHGGTARFSAAYQIFTPGLNPASVTRRTFEAPDAPWNGRDFAQLARLLSDDVAALGRDIAAALPSG